MKEAELKNVCKLKYGDAKGVLKEDFNNFMKNPDDYGVKDPEQVAKIQKVHDLSKHYSKTHSIR